MNEREFLKEVCERLGRIAHLVDKKIKTPEGQSIFDHLSSFADHIEGRITALEEDK